MTVLLRALALVTVLAGSLLLARPSGSDNYYDWSRYPELGDSSGWAAYFKSHALVRLGAEQRLPNGVSWRLLTDLRSGIAMPRLTWMSDRQHLLTANRLLDTVHGGEMLIEARERALEETGGRPLPVPHALDQDDVGLTYAGTRLMSVMSAASATMGGPDTPGYLRGLTFDLDKRTITTVAACPGSPSPYGPDGQDPPDYRFAYGDLLRLCDAKTYADFVALVKEVDDARPSRHLPPTASDQTKGCLEWPGRPLVREEQEYAVYLTFSGLAVQVGGHECPIARRPDNPIIVPYRRLAPLMLPGPWKDELLK
jgi:hypothetical protein